MGQKAVALPVGWPEVAERWAPERKLKPWALAGVRTLPFAHVRLQQSQGGAGAINRVTMCACESLSPIAIGSTRQAHPTRRTFDFSQFKPRGHYTAEPSLEQYFRAMIWLGRVDLRLMETQLSGEQVFQRRQYDAMLLFNELLSGPALGYWQNIDTAVETFVGESDTMRVPEVTSLRELQLLENKRAIGQS